MKLGEEITFSIADWLTKPRAELAALCDDWLTRIQVLEQGHREDKLLFTFLSDAHFPKAWPIFREAKYSSRAGFSLPPYAKEGVPDNDLALHLARYGDVEAARQLIAEPGPFPPKDLKGRLPAKTSGPKSGL